MVKDFLNQLKSNVSKNDFNTILNMAADDIRFNMINFNKKVTPEYFITICKRCQKVLNKCSGGM